MNIPFKDESSSELASYGSYKQTNLSRFLASITPSLLKDMQRYLRRNKFLHEISNFDPHKISLYQDVYAIVTLKQREKEIFNVKGKLRQVIQEIAENTKRKFVTIDERLKKKIYQLNPDQLTYYLDNEKDIIFRGNSKHINTDEWPEHLKKGLRNYSSEIDGSSAIDLDSENQSIMSSIGNQNKKRLSKPKSQKKKEKTSVIEEVIRIMNEPEGNDEVYWPEQKNSTEIVEGPQINQIINFQNPVQREGFAEKVIEGWNQKNMQNYLTKQQKLISESKICYNFKSREYLFLNPQIMKSVFRDLKKEEQIQIRHKERQEEAKRMFVNRKNREKSEKIRQTQRHEIQLIEVEDNQFTNTLRKNGQYHQKNRFPVIQIEDSFSQYQSYNDTDAEVNAQNLIQFLEDFVKNTNLEILPQQARQLLEEGLKIKDQAKIALLKKTQKNKPSETAQKQKNYNILNLLSDDSNSEQKEHDKDPVYWFNNDQILQAEYKKNPFKNRYLMWNSEEDNILQKVNQDFNSYSSDLQKLIRLKSAEMVKRRIDFLCIKMNLSLKFCIENFLK